jgi:hypothetical protein
MCRKEGAETVLVIRQLGKEVIRSFPAPTVSICEDEFQWLFSEGDSWEYCFGGGR